MIRVAGQAVVIFSAVTIPPQPGIPMSSRTTSGRRSRANRSASSPQSACPTTTRSGSAASECTTPPRNSGWSSATRMRMLSASLVRLLGQRQCRADHGAPVWGTLNVEATAEKLDAFAHSLQPQMATVDRRLGIEPPAFVAHVDDELPVDDIQRHTLVAGTAMAEPVGERLLQQPEQRNPHR